MAAGGGDITDEALKAKFVETDTDGSGALDATELHNLFESMGKPVSVDTLTNLIKLTVRPRPPNHSRASAIAYGAAELARELQLANECEPIG